MRLVRLLAVAATVGLVACEQTASDSLAPSMNDDPRTMRSSPQLDEEELGSARGSGSYSINGLIVDFSLEAEVEKHGKGEGEFRIFADEGDGLTVDFVGKVTCLAIDPVNRRAWIGGKVKSNGSTDPTLQSKIHRPGKDIWFRILDEPTGDRSTFVGFEGSAGFITSEEYCAGRPWPAENARTWPVVAGGFEIQP
jgi:hypothetical protein